jgi:tetratricopeptide (TPR) repeat protein
MPGILLAAPVLVVATLYATRAPESATPLTVTSAGVSAARLQPPRAAERYQSTTGTGHSSFDEAAYAKGDGALALAQYEDAVARSPENAGALSSLAQLLVRLHRVEEAIPHFERAIALEPRRAMHRVNLARALGLLHRWDESIAAYRYAQQLFPADYVITSDLALTLHKKGDDAAAVEEYQKAIALDPGDASVRMAIAESYEALNRPREAATAYGEYLRLFSSAPDAEQVRAHIAALTAQPVTPPAAESAPNRDHSPVRGQTR